ncbi:MAG: ATP synthase F0 subunit C [Bdellovibrionales bacterium]|jgi:F-type H+-transporting ATPase subunit c|nr:ATP synthase F0 subunit C [Bdellovibrionales bacterium]MBT3525495.1 ATP synthase F0 subunit C [Bdellovibrionales bacterium]MBT7670408.1 ATP synthase F0 subunit C [Bdellovibrionales bacterium]MBT7766754.1 ATP synthase F0 subunit C [Bdellovibrionales bacterium]
MKKILFLMLATMATTAFAGEGSGFTDNAALYFAYPLGVALAAFGGTQGQSRAIAAALEGIARNPNAAGKIQTPMILGLALIESLVIFTFISVFVVR